MEHDPGETLSTFFDGEPVEPAALADALATPAAPQLLRDFALLRACVALDDSLPSPDFYRRMEKVLKSGR